MLSSQITMKLSSYTRYKCTHLLNFNYLDIIHYLLFLTFSSGATSRETSELFIIYANISLEMVKLLTYNY